MTNRYQKGKIYKIINDVNDDIYIGSSCISLAKRKYYHKYDMKKSHKVALYSYLGELNLTLDDCRIILVEEYSCDNKMELIKREQYWIDELKPKYNKIRAYRPIEFRKKYQNESNRKYYNSHKKKIREYRKKYRETHKDYLKKKYNENKKKINKK